MTTILHEFKATYAFMERNANLVKRYWTWELVWLAYSIANSLSVSYIGLGMEVLTGASAQQGQYLVFYLLIGTLVWRFLSSLFNSISEMIQWERWEGTIEELTVTLAGDDPRQIPLFAKVRIIHASVTAASRARAPSACARSACGSSPAPAPRGQPRASTCAGWTRSESTTRRLPRSMPPNTVPESGSNRVPLNSWCCARVINSPPTYARSVICP